MSEETTFRVNAVPGKVMVRTGCSGCFRHTPLARKKPLPGATICGPRMAGRCPIQDCLDPAIRWKYEIQEIFKAPDLATRGHARARLAQRIISIPTEAADPTGSGPSAGSR